jgi:peptide deformylase|tara:strand:- start:2117 stop:2638 length:522 start_codon:yes stop_codon:yes gene_type:complete
MARIIPIGDLNDMLRQVMPEFDFSNPIKDPSDLSKELIDTMEKGNGIGLAANQIGIPARVFAIATEPTEVIFNPVVTYESEEQVNMDEGCLSYPGVFVKVKRAKDIRVRYFNLHGEMQTRKYSGNAARVCLHEIDHLDGIEYFTRAHAVNLARFKRKWEKMKRVLRKVSKQAK